MSQLPSTQPTPHSANPSAAPAIEPGFDVLAQAFWDKNSRLILLAIAAALLAIVGREGWQYFAALRENDIQAEYARSADKPDKLAAFAAAHAGHVLAGVAYLQVADQKFEAADYQQAATFYTKAAGNLQNDALLGRARLGAAISQFDAGDKTAGEASLKALGADQSVLSAVRAEALYHLASITVDAGRTDDARKLIEEVTKIDLGGAWSQRATALLANLPAAGATPSISFKPEGK